MILAVQYLFGHACMFVLHAWSWFWHPHPIAFVSDQFSSPFLLCMEKGPRNLSHLFLYNVVAFAEKRSQENVVLVLSFLSPPGNCASRWISCVEEVARKCSQTLQGSSVAFQFDISCSSGQRNTHSSKTFVFEWEIYCFHLCLSFVSVHKSKLGVSQNNVVRFSFSLSLLHTHTYSHFFPVPQIRFALQKRTHTRQKEEGESSQISP